MLAYNRWFAAKQSPQCRIYVYIYKYGKVYINMPNTVMRSRCEINYPRKESSFSSVTIIIISRSEDIPGLRDITAQQLQHHRLNNLHHADQFFIRVVHALVLLLLVCARLT